jgi:hypothetical protein
MPGLMELFWFLGVLSGLGWSTGRISLKAARKPSHLNLVFERLEMGPQDLYRYSDPHLADQVETTDKPITNSAGSEWAMLGELILVPIRDAGDMIQPWIGEILGAYPLPAEYLARVGQAAEDAVSQVFEPGSTRLDAHIHVRVFTSGNIHIDPDTKQTWGFFSINRNSLDNLDDARVIHYLELYLYIEG